MGQGHMGRRMGNGWSGDARTGGVPETLLPYLGLGYRMRNGLFFFFLIHYSHTPCGTARETDYWTLDCWQPFWDRSLSSFFPSRAHHPTTPPPPPLSWLIRVSVSAYYVNPIHITIFIYFPCHSIGCTKVWH